MTATEKIITKIAQRVNSLKEKAEALEEKATSASNIFIQKEKLGKALGLREAANLLATDLGQIIALTATSKE